jgi:hypothetical protein
MPSQTKETKSKYAAVSASNDAIRVHLETGAPLLVEDVRREFESKLTQLKLKYPDLYN